MSMLSSVLAVATVITSALFAAPAAWGAQTASGSAAAVSGTSLIVAAEDLKWGPGPPNLPKGEMAVLTGDPGKPGPFIVRGRYPDGTVFPPHRHSQDESLTILLGTVHLGTGDTFDKTKTVPVTVGGFSVMPAGTSHFAWTEGQVVMQVSVNGPFDVNYVNPKDDPSKQAQK